MKLYIAEKPSLGRAIAAVLPKPHKNQKTHIELANGDVVTWCVGHILEMAEPDQYDPKYKSWQLAHLPIHPTDWQLKPKYKTRGQLTAIRKLCKQATVIVHAGDPDREGQLLVDEVLNYIKLPKAKIESCRRVLISDLTANGVKKALTHELSNLEYRALSTSALARSRADWLFGLNLTRGCTIKGKSSGYSGVLSIGRVQTPVLSLIVKRESEIDHFVPHDFFEVLAHIQPQQQTDVIIQAKWLPSEACQPHMDQEGRIINQALAENVCQRIQNQPAELSSNKEQVKKSAPPLPFNLSSLQIEAAKAFSMSAQTVLSVCQSLYEKHNLITYPRSDCRFLPKAQLPLVSKIMGNLARSGVRFADKINQANLSQVSRAFDDRKVGAHHGIIPTEKAAQISKLNDQEAKLYTLISRNYAAQFFPHSVTLQQILTFIIAGGQFEAKGQHIKSLGWQMLLEKPIAKDNLLPQLIDGDSYHCLQGEFVSKQTSPPAYFNDASLLSAMTGIARFVDDPVVKSTLKETDGLGTEATRAGIIETLFKRNYIFRQGKNIRASDIGKTLISTIPEDTYSIERTARWEQALNQIADGQHSYREFINQLDDSLAQLIEKVKNLSFNGLAGKSAHGNKGNSKRFRKFNKSGTKSRKQKSRV